MVTLLQLQSSIFADHGVSSQLSAALVQRWLAANPGGRVIRRDLGSEPLPHLDAARITALSTPAQDHTPEQAAVVAQSDRLIEEWRDADYVVMGVPLYNFGIPSQLKSYFDHIARAKVTFQYRANGPEGLLKDRPTVVLASRGGYYRTRQAGGTDPQTDPQTAHLKDFLGLVGIRNLHFVYAEGLNMGAEAKDQALAAARRQIDALPLNDTPADRAA